MDIEISFEFEGQARGWRFTATRENLLKNNKNIPKTFNGKPPRDANFQAMGAMARLLREGMPGTRFDPKPGEPGMPNWEDRVGELITWWAVFVHCSRKLRTAILTEHYDVRATFAAVPRTMAEAKAQLEQLAEEGIDVASTRGRISFDRDDDRVSIWQATPETAIVFQTTLVERTPAYPRAADPPTPPKFARLAEATLKVLANPGGAGVSAELGKGFVELKLARDWGKKERERLFKAGFSKTHVQLRNATKFVFNDDFSALVMEASTQDPIRLAQLAQTARLPAEPCWIEFNRRFAIGDDGPYKPGEPRSNEYWGALLSRRTDIPDEDQYEITMVSHPTPERPPIILPGAVLLSLRGEANSAGLLRLRPVGAWTPQSLVLHPAYCNLWHIDGEAGTWPPRYWKPVGDIIMHCKNALGVGPYGPALRKFVAAAERDQHSKHWKLINVLSIISLLPFRELLTGLALLATHVGGSPLIKETVTKSGQGFFQGRYHPVFEYKVLQLARPMTAPYFWRRVFRRRPAMPTREHQVKGSWHHRRALNPTCYLHPRACPMAVWQPTDPDLRPGFIASAPPKIGDVQECILCKRHRWYVQAHRRGDRRLGIVEKDYEITATRGPS